VALEVYVPWRGMSPLLRLRSVKPPVPLYSLLIERGEFRLPMLKAGGEVELELLVLSDRERPHLISGAQVYLFRKEPRRLGSSWRA